MMAMGGYLYALNTMDGGNAFVAVLLALLVPGLMGAVNGLIVTRTMIPSFITTLSTMFIYRGIVWLLSQGQMLQTIEDLLVYNVFNGRLGVIADALQGANFRTSALWWIALVLIVQWVLVRTKFGNHVFATGGSVDAAGATGVNVKRVKLACFIVSGLLSGLAGILLFSQFKTVKIASGAGTELLAIASAVVGGTSLAGGYGSIIGGFLGVLIISMLRTGVVLTNLIPADNFEAIVGVTIILAVIFNNWIHRKA
jgi:simple sugar transport system permease protein